MAKSTSSNELSYSSVGAGTPLVLIHAFPTDQRLWKQQQEGLKNYFRVITLDLYGFGQSGAVNGEAITMDAYADQVKQLLDQLHIDKAIIGGESMGGYIALAFLAHYPERVEGMILSDTQSIADSAEAKNKREATAQEVLQHGPATFVKGFMGKALSPTASEQLKNNLFAIVSSQSATAIASAARGMGLRFDTTNALANAKQPILILVGDQDAVISPEQSEKMHSVSKMSKLVILENAGHLSNLEQPKKWNEAVINMFNNQLLN